MPEGLITEVMMRGFQDELEKEAAIPWQAIGGGAGTGLGLGVLGGGALGTLAGGIKGYSQAREQGEGVGGAALSGIRGGLTGGITGAALGGGIGGLGGAAAGALRPAAVKELATNLAAREGPLGVGARLGQRQIHSFTGWNPKGGIESIRGGAYDARKEMVEAKKALTEAEAGKGEVGYFRSMLDKVRGKTPEEIQAGVVGRAKTNVGTARKKLTTASEAQRMGLTSLPGYYKALTGKVPGVKPLEAVQAGLKEQWHSSGLPMKALMVGFPTAATAGALMGKESPGEGRGEAVGKALGSIGYTLAPFSIPASIVAGEGLTEAGGMVGKGVDWLRRRMAKKEPIPPPATEPGDTGLATPVERYAGPAMSGQIPEMG